MSLLLAFFIFAGGYLGYLSALVDLDEQAFLERVIASTDKELLEKQLARAKSILEARSRAYIRRSQEFILKKQAEMAQEFALDKDIGEIGLAEINEALTNLSVELDLSSEERQFLQGLEEERSDVGFFQDEVETIESMLARGLDESELDLALAELRKKKRLTGALRELLQLLDKRKEISLERDAAKDRYTYWETYPKSAPDGVVITVKNKGVLPRELNPLHVTQISTGLSVMPGGFDNRIRTLYIVYGDPKMRRGMAGVGVVFMKGEQSDFFRVMVHEFGHIWDLFREVEGGPKSDFYDGPYRLFTADPSVEFYQYSWANAHDRSVSDKKAYASSYGYTDPFEDFAEAFALYVLQGPTFTNWRNDHGSLARKYEFIFDIYDNRTFRSSQNFSTRPYDVTMLSVDYNSLLSN